MLPHVCQCFTASTRIACVCLRRLRHAASKGSAYACMGHRAGPPFPRSHGRVRRFVAGPCDDNDCAADETCVSEPKQCVAEPCPQYRCDEAAGPEGTLPSVALRRVASRADADGRVPHVPVRATCAWTPCLCARCVYRCTAIVSAGEAAACDALSVHARTLRACGAGAHALHVACLRPGRFVTWRQRGQSLVFFIIHSEVGARDNAPSRVRAASVLLLFIRS